MNTEQKLACSLDDLIKKDTSRQRRGGRNQTASSYRSRPLAGRQKQLQRGVSSGRGQRRGRGRLYSGKGGRPLSADVVMSDMATQGQSTNRVRSTPRGKRTIGGLSVTRKGLIGKKGSQQLQKGRFNKVAARLEGFRMNRATAYRANTSLVRRQMGFRENMAMLSARRRQLKGGAFASINDLRRVGGIRHTQSQTIGGIRKRPVHAGGRLFGQQRSGFALQRPNPNARGFDLLRGQAQTSGSITAPASSSGSSDALLKQIKIVAELDQVPPPLLCQIADAERRLGRRLSDNLNSPNGRQFGGQLKKRPLTLSDRFP